MVVRRMSSLAAMVDRLRRTALRGLYNVFRGTAGFYNMLADALAPRLEATRSRADQRAHPVLCFGDSISEGYHNIWPHGELAPHRSLPPDVEAHEHTALLCHPYSIRLGQLLAADVGDGAGGYQSSLRYARVRAYSGWTAEQLLPVLCRSLSEGPWRCVVIMAGVNDVIKERCVNRMRWTPARPHVGLHAACMRRTRLTHRSFNSRLASASAASILGRLEQLYAVCDAAGVPVVALTNLEADLGEFFTPDEVPAMTDALDEVSRGVLEMRSRRVVADARAALPINLNLPPPPGEPRFFDDAVHLTPAGSDKLAELIFQAMKFHGL